jgi:hypothetical protein
MPRERIAFGDAWLEVDLPEGARVLRPPAPLPALPDFPAAFREAIARPYEHEPIGKLVGPGARVTIAFDDPCMPIYPERRPMIREQAIPILLETLERAGVSRHDVSLVCANALHRKWTTRELETILGPEIPHAFGPSRLFCHDAEDPEALVHLGETERGMEVVVSRLVLESDLFVYLSVPVSPFNGGWKSTVVGLSAYDSIRHHHRPFPKASGKSVMDHHRSAFPKLLGELGAVVRRELERRGRRIFQIETVTNLRIPHEPIGVFAGEVTAAHRAALELMDRQQVLPVRGQSDVLVLGLTNADHYGKLSVFNPILVRNWGLSYAFGRYQGRPVLREGGILILAHPAPNQWSARTHPSYVELWERVLPTNRDPFDLWDTHAEEYARRPGFVHRYRYGYAMHGVHPLILWGQGAFALRHCSRVFLAGVEEPWVAERLGFEAFPSVEAALAEARATLGAGASVTYLHRPPEWTPAVDVDDGRPGAAGRQEAGGAG